MSKLGKDEFKFYVPINLKKAKGEDKGETEMILEGLAGDGGTDTAGENLSYNGFDLNRMFYINWEHSKEPEDVIGVIVDKQLKKGGKLFIKGKLFSDHKKARDAYQLQEFLEKEGHNLGFSVEGKVMERDPINPKVVTKAELYGVALCKVPVNPVTYARIAKAFTNGEDIDDEEEENEEEVEKMTTADIAPAMPESVEKKEKKLGVLTKSQVYMKIFNKFTNDPSIADRIYNLINQISLKMEKPITEDLVKKAEEILGLVETPSAEDTIEKGGQGDMAIAGEENGGDIVTLQKAMNDAKADYLEKAKAYESMCKAKGIEPEMEEDSIQKSQIDADLIKGIIVGAIDEKLSVIETLEKAINIRTQALGTLIVDDRKQIGEISEALEKANTAIETITEFNEDLRERLNVVERTPIRKAVTTSNYVERFEGKERTSNANVFNINDRKKVEELAKSIEAKFGFDLDNEKNQKMMEAASTLVMTNMVLPEQQELLKSEGYELVQF
jgi:hypothetical protein